MAPAKFALVLAVFVSAALGQTFNQNVMESRHRAVGYRLPPPIYVRQQGPTYNVHHAQHFTSNPIPLRRPSVPVHHVRPAHVAPHVHHLPAYQIPYPAPRPTSNYAVPVASRPYVAPTTPRPYVTPTTPRPVFPSPVHPTRSPYFHPSYVNPQQAPVAPAPPVRPVPTRAPFHLSAPTHKPAPPVDLSLLDLPWVKPLYARNQVTPKPYYYGNPSNLHWQEVKPAPVVIKQEDPGVSISSVGSPLPESISNPPAVANNGFEVREIPRGATAFNVPAPVSAATATQRPVNVIISDDSGEDIRVIQQVNTPAPSRATPPAMIQQMPASNLRVSPLVTTTRPAQEVVLDNSDEDIRFIQQELPVTASMSAPPAAPLLVVDDSVEDFRIVQQVQASNVPVTSPRTPPTAATSFGTSMAEGLGLRNMPQTMRLPTLSVTSSAVTAPQGQAVALAVSDESGEDIFRQVPVSNGQVVGPRVTTARPEVGIFVADSSDEDVRVGSLPQQGSGPASSPLNTGTVATQLPLTSVSISDDSNEDLRIVQRVPVLNAPVPNVAVPSSRPSVTGTSSFTVVDTSDEDIVLRNTSQEINRPLLSASRQAVPANVFDDSVEDLRIVQQVPVPNVRASSPSTTTRPGPSFVVLDRSEEDVLLRNIQQQTISLSSGSASIPATQATNRSLAFLDDSLEDVQIVRQGSISNISTSSLQAVLANIEGNSLEVPDNSNEDFELRLISQPVSVPTLSASRPPQPTPSPGVFLVDSGEDVQIVREVSLSNNSSSIGGTSRIVLRDSAEDFQTNQRVPQPTVSLSGSAQSAGVAPLIRLVDSAEDIQVAREVSLSSVPLSAPVNRLPVISYPTAGQTRPSFLVDSAQDIQIVQQIALSNAASSGMVAETPRIFLRDSAEDFQVDQRIPQSSVSLSGPAQSTGTSPLVRLVDSDEDEQVVREVPLSNVLLSAPVSSTGQPPLSFLVDSEEDTRIVQGNILSNVTLSGPVSTGGGPVLLVDSAEDTQEFLRSNASLSSTSTSGVVLVESAEDIESPVLPLLQSVNQVQIQERELDDNRSEEDVQTRVTISGGSIVLVNPTSV